MPVSVRRLALGLLLGGAVLAGNTSPTPVMAQGCDPNYGITPGGCVPGDRDYDCPELHARGIGDIPVIGNDWQRLDGYFDYDRGIWLSYPDGLGCEWYGEQRGDKGLSPIAAQTSDPSYQDFCIQPPSEVGDLECWQVGYSNFTVYQPDPQYFDGDYDGIGCEGQQDDSPKSRRLRDG